jgi:murein L,D-transpeptidase YcbB/YkuD
LIRGTSGKIAVYPWEDFMGDSFRRIAFSWGAAILSMALASAVAGQPAAVIRDRVAAGTLEGMRWPNFSDYRGWLEKFYGPAQYAPAWLDGSKPTSQALFLIGRFREAGKKGLDPEAFDASRWDERIRALKDSSDAAAARFDVAMTVSAMRYVSDLRIGRIHPRHFAFGLSIDQKKYDLARFLRDRIVGAPSLPETLDAIEPPFGGYRRTEQALARYVELAAADGAGEKLPAVAKAVAPGAAWDGVPRLTRLLRLVGDLPADAAVPEGSRTYGGPLVDAVKRFQRRHGLADDGKIGAGTVERLNVPLADRVRQLGFALERWRWLPSEFPSPPIVVNIPDFRLRALDEANAVALEMRVVVGKAMRNQTPVFSDEMTYVVFRPYWNVPGGIRRNEIVPAIQRDRNYVANKGYEVTTPAGKPVTSGRISDDVLAGLRSGKLMVRQKPGPTNSLGLVKLIFPNDFSVYLHDTPAREVFSRTRRDFSHGCIRVEKPAELAAWALRKNPGWDLERVRQAMQSGKNDVTVNLAQRVPVFIVYATALADEKGEVHFYDDIYGHDAELAAALARGYPYP